ncbi:unnamed protein product, partial [Phaeothamnion confervicola]
MEEEAKSLLRALNTCCASGPKPSASKVEGATKIALQMAKDYKRAVHVIESFIRKARPEHKLVGCYVVDAVVKNSWHKYGRKDVFAPRFAQRMATETLPALLTAQKSHMPSIHRVVREWRDKRVFGPLPAYRHPDDDGSAAPVVAAAGNDDAGYQSSGDDALVAPSAAGTRGDGGASRSSGVSSPSQAVLKALPGLDEDRREADPARRPERRGRESRRSNGASGNGRSPPRQKGQPAGARGRAAIPEPGAPAAGDASPPDMEVGISPSSPSASRDAPAGAAAAGGGGTARPPPAGAAQAGMTAGVATNGGPGVEDWKLALQQRVKALVGAGASASGGGGGAGGGGAGAGLGHPSAAVQVGNVPASSFGAPEGTVAAPRRTATSRWGAAPAVEQLPLLPPQQPPPLQHQTAWGDWQQQQQQPPPPISQQQLPSPSPQAPPVQQQRLPPPEPY